MRLEYLGLRAGIAPVRALPLETASAVSGRLWRGFAPRMHRHARVREHLAFAFPELSEEARERIAVASWENLGRVVAESAHVDELVADPSRFELPADIDRYRRLARTGCVFVSLHLGNWEVAALPALGKSVSVAGTSRRSRTLWSIATSTACARRSTRADFSPRATPRPASSFPS